MRSVVKLPVFRANTIAGRRPLLPATYLFRTAAKVAEKAAQIRAISLPRLILQLP